MNLTAEIYLEKKWVPNPKDFAVLKRLLEESTAEPGVLLRTYDDALSCSEYRDCLKQLEKAGLKRMTQARMFKYYEKHPERLKGYVCIDVRREFTVAECADSELVRLFPGANICESCFENPDGELGINVDDFYNESDDVSQETFTKGRLPFFALKFNSLVISDQTRRLFEASGLTGWRATRRVRITGRYASDVTGKYWHLEVPGELPHSPQMRWWGADGEYRVAWTPGAVVPDDGQHTFDRAAWKQLGCPDLMSHLRCDPKDPQARLYFYVVSHRCFEFCKANKLKSYWEPVDLVG